MVFSLGKKSNIITNKTYTEYSDGLRYARIILLPLIVQNQLKEESSIKYNIYYMPF